MAGESGSAPANSPARRQSADNFSMRLGVASIWLLTAVLVVVPYYRAVGARELAALSLPAWLMYVACAGELVLGSLVLARPLGRPLVALQLGGLLFFTVVLALGDPLRLAHPFGILTKNLPLAALIVAAYWHAREGHSARVVWLLRAGMASVWITEGILPKLLFPREMELAIVRNSHLVPFDALTFLRLLGVAQALSGVLALVLRGRALRWLLLAQTAALIVLPLLVGVQQPLLFVHPFTPLLKNVPIIFGTLIVWRHSRRGAAGHEPLVG